MFLPLLLWQLFILVEPVQGRSYGTLRIFVGFFLEGGFLIDSKQNYLLLIGYLRFTCTELASNFSRPERV